MIQKDKQFEELKQKYIELLEQNKQLMQKDFGQTGKVKGSKPLLKKKETKKVNKKNVNYFVSIIQNYQNKNKNRDMKKLNNQSFKLSYRNHFSKKMGSHKMGRIEYKPKAVAKRKPKKPKKLDLSREHKYSTYNKRVFNFISNRELHVKGRFAHKKISEILYRSHINNRKRRRRENKKRKQG